MSTIKSDSVIPVSSNTDLSLSGSGTGGVKVTDYLVQTKGSDISSATSLTLGKDGNAFDVTGTTTITSIATQGIGSHVTLHFDAALTFTHHSTDLILPGAANITTAAGDIAIMYEYASADWRCVSYTKASGAAVVAAGGGGYVFLGSVVTASASTVDFESLINSTYDDYLIVGIGVLAVVDNGILYAKGSIDNGSNYLEATSSYHSMTWGHEQYSSGNPSETWITSRAIAQMRLGGISTNFQSDATAGATVRIQLSDVNSTTSHKNMEAYYTFYEGTTYYLMSGQAWSTIRTTSAINAFRLYMSSGNIKGSYYLYGLTKS